MDEKLIRDELGSPVPQHYNETAVVAKGGTVNKTGNMATFQELRSGILSISTGGTGDGDGNAGVPLGTIVSEYVTYPTLNVIENINITFEEAGA